MKTFTAVIVLFASMVAAVPATLDTRASVCPSTLNSLAKCCDVDVLGVADLNCSNPSEVPTSFGQFKSICGKEGKAPSCCTLDVGGVDLLCNAI